MDPQPQQQPIQIDKMKESPHVRGDTDYRNVEETDIDETKIFWMGTNANLADTPQEQLENKLAIQEQIRKGILDEAGIPTGFTYDELGIPKHVQEQLIAQKAARKAGGVQKPGMPGAPQQIHSNTPEPKKVYKNKYERQRERQLDREAQKRAEKLAKANRLIQLHQQQTAPRHKS
jgi:hypothetical protein